MKSLEFIRISLYPMCCQNMDCEITRDRFSGRPLVQPPAMVPLSYGKEQSTLFSSGSMMTPASPKVKWFAQLIVEADHHSENCEHWPELQGRHGSRGISSVASQQWTVRPTLVRSSEGIALKKMSLRRSTAATRECAPPRGATGAIPGQA